MLTKKVAVSACLMGESCRFDGTNNYNNMLLEALRCMEVVPFCPEDFSFGTPRPTMDLVKKEKNNIRAISNESGTDLSEPIIAYAKDFFDTHSDIDLFIGKDRSPSCGVCSSKCYDQAKKLISTEETGLMAMEAKHRGIKAVDVQTYLKDFRV
ncbi:MAG: DUF523 domain-containing protein [Sulfurovum sp.]|nr:DUF523 domain-containing protein [Sulfurovum sp.]